MSFFGAGEVGPSFQPFATLREQFGFIPGLFRAQTLLPVLIGAEVGLIEAVLFTPHALSRVQKECILLVTAAASGNSACLAIHYHMLRSLSVPEPQLDRIATDPLQAKLSPVNQALVSLAAKLIGGSSISREDVGSLTNDVALEAVLNVGLGRFLCTLAAGVGAAPDFPVKEFPAVTFAAPATETQPSERWVLALRASELRAFAILKELFGFIPSVFKLQTSRPDVIEAETEILRVLFRERKVPLTGLGPELLAFMEEPTADGIQRLRHNFRDEQILEAAVMAATSNFLKTLELGLGAQPDLPLKHFIRPAKKKAHLSELIGRQTDGGLYPDPDASLVAKVCSGDLDAFEELMTRHSQRVYRTLIAILGDGEEARDAMQDTFLKAFQHLGGFEGRSKFSTWLLSIASNAGVQRLRDKKALESLDESEFESEEGFRPRQVQAWTENPEQLYSRTEMRGLIERSIMRLPAKYRMVLMLRDIEQLSTEECASAAGLGIPAFKARLLRGRLMLREALAPYFAAPAQGSAKGIAS